MVIFRFHSLAVLMMAALKNSIGDIRLNTLRIFQPRTFLVAALCIILLQACTRTSTEATQQADSFLPPTPAPSVTSVPPTDAPLPTQPADCENVLSFMKDITIPDGTEVKPGEELDKRWQIRNNGTCDWNSEYTLRLIFGDAMGSAEEQALVPLRSGNESPIRVILTAPQEPGTYRSGWQAYSAKDEAFGDPIYIEIVVAEK